MSFTGPSELDRLARAGADALQRKDPRTALRMFQQVVSVRARDMSAWVGLAFACRDLGDDEAQLAALDKVLAIDPGHLPALLMKADHFDRTGDGRSAHAFYRSAVDRGRALGNPSPALQDQIRRAEDKCASYVASYEAHLQETLSRSGFNPLESSRRFARSVDLLLGKKQLFLQSPRSYYFPELPQRQFYERSEFSWLPALEARTAAIREELLALVGEPQNFRPYVQSDGRRPSQSFYDLVDNPDWGAFYLVKSGAVATEAAARCPRTMEALEQVPLAWSEGRTPSVLFSLLRPATRIPPHTGYTNARLICHLPLIVPGGCGLRVGNEVRHWTVGETLIFDDSIEHEAWNDSDQLRVVLLFDVWRPELTEDEVALVAATLAAVGSYDTGPVD
jgi:aspartate beta-hydroxylase